MKRLNFRVLLGISFFLGSVIFIAISRHYRALSGITWEEAAWAFFLNIGTEMFGAAVIFFMLEIVLRRRDETAVKADEKSDAIMRRLYTKPDMLLTEMQDEERAREIVAALSDREKGEMLLELARRQSQNIE